MKVKQAVILAAGLNSRMFPMSKVIPKAALPLGTKPVIHYLAEECKAAGIKKIIIVQNKRNNLIEQYFSRDKKLESLLLQKGKKNLLRELKKIQSLGKMRFVLQKEPLGEAHALLKAKNAVAGKPFALLYGDTLYRKKDKALKQVLGCFSLHKKHVFGATGRFVFLPSIFTLLDKIDFAARENMVEGKGLSLPSIFLKYLSPDEFFQVKIIGKRYDVGSSPSYLSAFQEFAKI